MTMNIEGSQDPLQRPLYGQALSYPPNPSISLISHPGFTAALRGDRIFRRASCDRTRGNGFKLEEGRFRADIQEIFYDEGDETPEQVAQRGGRCPILGNIQGQVGWGSEQPDVVVDVPAYCRGIGLDDLERSLPTQTIQRFYEIRAFSTHIHSCMS